MQVQPYLFFDGRSQEALAFYQNAVGAEVSVRIRYRDHPEPHDPAIVRPGMEDKVMHAAFRIGDTMLLASDGRCMGQPNFQGFALTILANDDAEADRLFCALSDGGQVTMALQKTFFSSRFGMLTDRFGIPWIVNCEQAA